MGKMRQRQTPKAKLQMSAEERNAWMDIVHAGVAPPPEGWYTARDLAKQLGIPWYTVRNNGKLWCKAGKVERKKFHTVTEDGGARLVWHYRLIGESKKGSGK